MDLILDFDGTLAETGTIVFNKLNGFATNPISLNELRNMPANKVIETMGISFFKLPFLIYAIRAELKKNIKSLKLVDGMRETLDRLREANFQLHIVSSNSTRNIRNFLELQCIEDHFSSVSGLLTIFDKASGIKKLIRNKGLDASKTIYIGDEARDIEAAQQTNIKSCFVCWGYQTEKALVDLKPDFIAKTPGDLIKMVHVE